MKGLLAVLVALGSIAVVASAPADPEYTTLRLEIEVAKPAGEVWAKVGKYCDLAAWLKVDCTITSGDGGIGTVRSIAGGRVIEVLVGRTDLSYGYTQPPKEGQFYNLYHGYLEAKPVTANTSKLIYTMMYDTQHMDQAAKDAEEARRRKMFGGALKNMKEIAEAG
jgi:hypothetical protein